MAVISTDIRCDLEKLVEETQLKGYLFSGDNNANVINVSVYKNNVPKDLTGWNVVGTVIKSDGTTLSSISGGISVSETNKAYLTLPSNVYEVPGKIRIIIKINLGSTNITIASLIANVYQSATATIIYP